MSQKYNEMVREQQRLQELIDARSSPANERSQRNDRREVMRLQKSIDELYATETQRRLFPSSPQGLASPLSPIAANVAYRTPQQQMIGRMQTNPLARDVLKFSRYSGPPNDWDGYIRSFEMIYDASSGARPAAGPLRVTCEDK